MVGRELICKFIKNNLSEGQDKSATFKFFHIETAQYGFGFDAVEDIINVGKVTGVLKGSGWLEHSTFPQLKNGTCALHGKDAVQAYLAEHPASLEQIRKEVMEFMADTEKAEGEAIRAKQAAAEVQEEESDG